MSEVTDFQYNAVLSIAVHGYERNIRGFTYVDGDSDPVHTMYCSVDAPGINLPATFMERLRSDVNSESTNVFIVCKQNNALHIFKHSYVEAKQRTEGSK